ncbi:ribosome biogenesis protein tsr1 [Massospora cicadina]|nr:ribosome biogenesis protein tsr1 [Massospora cicadina]
MGRVSTAPFHHRATLKQQNKPFKSKFASKGALKDKAKGKVERATYQPNLARRALNKPDRKNAAKMTLRNRKAALAIANRIFSGRRGASKIVVSVGCLALVDAVCKKALVPLSPDVTSLGTAERLFASAGKPMPADTVSPGFEGLKHALQFVCPERNLYDVMDACKVADHVVFILSGEVEVDAFGELCVASVQSQGIPNSFNLAANLGQLSAKRQAEVKKSLSSFMSYFFPENDKIHALESDQECQYVLRSIVSQSPRPLPWRENHPYLLADKLEYLVNPEDPSTGTLVATGFVRGKGLSANRLVHLQNLGDFQLNRIEKQSIPGLDHHQGCDESGGLLDVPSAELQDSLACENVPDSMEGEQTWPTEEELQEADRLLGINAEQPKRRKMVVKGTSSYQAAWIAESDEEEGGSEDGIEDGVESEGSEGAVEPAEHEETDEQEEYEEPLDAEEDLLQYEAYVKQRQEEFQTDRQFPDEVDTPRETPARIRFQRYRGLLSMRTSPWDAYENLPADYSRIFQFQNFARTRRRVLALAEDAPAKVGSYVSIHIANVPRSFEDVYNPRRPFIVFGLLQHENKMTVVNYTVLRTTEYKDPIRSKDPLIVQSGFRRYCVRPIFSQNSKRAKNTNNVYKMERFLRHHASSVMTFFGQVSFAATPALVFKENPHALQEPILVALGSFKDTDPTRIVAKRIVLTGHPFRVNRRSAVIRYMFFNSADVEWFKPIQLSTKFGRVGHIRDSIGTHGYMKCVFDGPMKQHDTVCMKLYKRVFPKWNTQLYTFLPHSHNGTSYVTCGNDMMD